MRSLLVAVFIFTCTISSAQQLPDYCVYLVKGKVTIIKKGARPLAVKQKQLLYKNEVLVLANNSEVTLINKDDNLLVWNTTGAVEIKELASHFIVSPPSITKSYLHLAFRELLDPDYDYSSFRKKNVGGVRGGVSRGDQCDNLIFPIKDLKTSEDSVRFKWAQSTTSNDYIFMLYDSLGKEIINTEVKDTQRIINLREALHEKTGKYYWMVKGKTPGCEDDSISFEIMSKKDEQKLLQDLILQKGSNGLLSQLNIIDELEKHKWIYSALHYYAAILHNHSGDVALAKSYILFLLKYSFEEEASNTWKGLRK